VKYNLMCWKVTFREKQALPFLISHLVIFGYFIIVHELIWRHITGTYDFFGLNYFTSRTAKAPKPTSDLKTDPDINVIFGNFSNATESAAPYDDVRFLTIFVLYCLMSFEY
jgi:hypothetical protein